MKQTTLLGVCAGFLALSLIAGLLRPRPATPPPATSYTYKEFSHGERTRYRDWRLDEAWHAPVSDILTDASSLGWELVWTDGTRYLLRRPYVPNRKPDPRWIVFEPNPELGGTR